MNSTETTTNLSQNNKIVSWIKFNTKTGKIYSISNTEIFSNQADIGIIQTTNPLALSARKQSLRKFSVKWDLFNECWDIAQDTGVLVIQDLNYPIYEITTNNPNTSDINVKIFKKLDLLEISANISSIKNSMNLSEIYQIITPSTVNMNLYLADKNDPDRYIATIPIEPNDLVKNGTIQLKLDNITDYVKWEDVSIHTRKVFNDYSIEFIDTVITKKSINNRPLQTADYAEGHIEISNVDGKVIVTSHINETNSYMVSGRNNLMFMVSDDIIDNIVGVFYVSTGQLIKKDILSIDIDFEWPVNPVLTYKNKYLNVTVVGGNQ